MKILNPLFSIDDFSKTLRGAPKRGLLLDYDGTLAPFHKEPARAFPYPGVTSVLDRIMDSDATRLVIISGRWIQDLLPLLPLRKQPEIWGSHGLERRRSDGTYEVAPMEEKAIQGLVEADEIIRNLGLSALAEEKPGCLAIHWRGLEEQKVAQIRNRVEPGWSALAQRSGLSLLEFDGGIELRVPARNKGDAVITICEELGEGIPVVYLGDDRTDEDAFLALKGKGVGVLVGQHFRETAADLWLTPPEELLEFLSQWVSEPALDPPGVKVT